MSQQPMEQQVVEYYENGELVETRTVSVPVPPAEVEEEQYRTTLAAEFTTFKAAFDALIAVPNATLGGGAREIKDFARATRRMLRVAIRELQAIDGGTT